MTGEVEIGIFLIFIFFFFRHNIDTGLVLKGPLCLNKDDMSQSQAFL